MRIAKFTALLAVLCCSTAVGGELTRAHYQRDNPAVDGDVSLWAWPLPMDYDADGDLDLVVSCPDVLFNGLYLFENRQRNPRLRLVEPLVRIGAG